MQFQMLNIKVGNKSMFQTYGNVLLSYVESDISKEPEK
jgi:hypothetical protein